MRHSFLLFWALSYSLIAHRAHGKKPDGAYRLPPALPAPPSQALPREPDDIPRRKLELIGAGSVGPLACSGEAPSSATQLDPCSTLSVAWSGDIFALWRGSSYYALGALGSYSHFTWDAKRGIGNPSADAASSASWSFLGIAARGYPLSEGRFEPYIGTAIGVGLLSLTTEQGSQSDTIRRQGFATALSLGLDTWLTAHLRLGPYLGLLWQPGSGSERCTQGICLTASGALTRVPNHAFRFGIAITLGLGDEL